MTKKHNGDLQILGYLEVLKHVNVGDNVTINGNSFIKLPVGDNSERPTTPVAGMFRFNSDNSLLEYYDGVNWFSINANNITGAGPITVTFDQMTNSYVIGVDLATATTVGVASFDGDTFDVDTGVVTIREIDGGSY